MEYSQVGTSLATLSRRGTRLSWRADKLRFATHSAPLRSRRKLVALLRFAQVRKRELRRRLRRARLATRRSSSENFRRQGTLNRNGASKPQEIRGQARILNRRDRDRSNLQKLRTLRVQSGGWREMGSAATACQDSQATEIEPKKSHRQPPAQYTNHCARSTLSATIKFPRRPPCQVP